MHRLDLDGITVESVLERLPARASSLPSCCRLSTRALRAASACSSPLVQAGTGLCRSTARARQSARPKHHHVRHLVAPTRSAAILRCTIVPSPWEAELCPRSPEARRYRLPFSHPSACRSHAGTPAGERQMGADVSQRALPVRPHRVSIMPNASWSKGARSRGHCFDDSVGSRSAMPAGVFRRRGYDVRARLSPGADAGTHPRLDVPGERRWQARGVSAATDAPPGAVLAPQWSSAIFLDAEAVGGDAPGFLAQHGDTGTLSCLRNFRPRHRRPRAPGPRPLRFRFSWMGNK